MPWLGLCGVSFLLSATQVLPALADLHPAPVSLKQVQQTDEVSSVQAQVALARARQLMAQGITDLGERELQHAASLAPHWIEPRRDLALWYSRSEQWQLAAASWRQVLALLDTDRHAGIKHRNAAWKAAQKEARARFFEARSHYSLQDAGPPLVTHGQDADATTTTPETRTLAVITPGQSGDTTGKSSATSSGASSAAATSAAATSGAGGSSPATSQPPATADTGMASTLPSVTRDTTPSTAVQALPSPSSRDHDTATAARSTPAKTRLAAVPHKARKNKARGPQRHTTARRAKAHAPHAPAAAGVHLTRSVAQGGVSQLRQAQAWPYVERAGKAMKAKKYGAALAQYRSANAIDPYNAFALNGIAESQLLMQRYGPSEAAYRRALAIWPKDAKMLRGHGDALFGLGRRGEAVRAYQQAVEIQPKDFKTTYQIAQLLTWSKHYNEADEYFRRAADLKPRNAEVWAAFGESLTYGHDADARAAFARSLQLRPNNPRALQGLANLYAWNGEYPNAIANYKKLLDVQPHNTTAWIGLGNALTYSEQKDAAIAAYRQALQIAPDSSEAHLGLGRALVYNSNYAEALPHLQRVVTGDPSNKDALMLLAQAQANGPAEGTTTPEDAAIATYQKLLSLQTDPAAQATTWTAIAQLREKQSRYDAAGEAYANALRLAPTNSDIALVYAQSLIYEDKWNDARNVVDDTLRRDPANLRALTLQVLIESKSGTPERTQALARRLEAQAVTNPEDALMLANALRNAGYNDAATHVVAHLAENAPEDPATALQVANAVRDAGLVEASIPLYQKLLAIDPGNTEARFKLAEALSWTKQYDAAEQQVNMVLSGHPDNVEARVLKASIDLHNGTPEARQAVEPAINQIIAQNPNNASAQVIKGELLTARQQFADAIEHYRVAIKADPNNIDAHLGLARNLYYSKQVTASITEYRDVIARVPTDSTVKLELAKIYLEQNQLNDAEALYHEVLIAGRTVLPPVAQKREGAGRVATLRSFARISPELAAKSDTGSVQRTSLRLAQAVSTPQNNTQMSGNAGGAAAAAPAAGSATTSANNNTTANATAGGGAASATSSAPSTANGTENGNGNNGAAAAPEASPAERVAALRGLGEVRRRQQRYDEAIDYFQQALAIDASDVGSRLGLAQSLRARGDYTQASTEVERVLTADPKNFNARVLRAQLFFDTHQPDKAQTELDAIVQSMPEQSPLETYLDLADAFNNLHQYDAALQMLEEAKQQYPTRPEVPRRQAETLTFAKRWNDALAIYNQLIAADPNDADAILGKARVYNYSDQLEQAEPLYRQVLQLEPENRIARVELADVLMRRNNWQESITLYRAAVKQDPTNLMTRVELARVLRYNRQFDESGSILNAVLETDPRFAPAYTERGILRGQQGNYEPAIADLRHALEITPTDLTAQFGLAEVLSYAKQYDESIRLYQTALQRDPTNQKGRVELGLVLSYAGRYNEALKEEQTVLTQNPQNVSAKIAKAAVLTRMQRVPEAITLYREVLATQKNDRRAQLGLAEAYVAAGRYDDAIAAYNTLIAAEPDNSAFRIARARTLGYAKRPQEAIAALRPIVAAEPTNVQARLALAQVMTDAGDPRYYNDAIRNYQTVISQQPNNIDAHVGLGRVYSYAGLYHDARAELQPVVDKYPDNQEALYALAETERFAGEPFDARSNYERVIKLDPNNDRAKEGLRLAKKDTQPSITGSWRRYHDTNGASLTTYLFGPTLPTRAGTIGVYGETGHFEQGGVRVNRTAVDLMLARRFGPLQARLLLSRLKYSGVPEKTLYDLLLQETPRPRQRYYAEARRSDIIESLGAVLGGITYREYLAGFEYPLADHIDIGAEARYYTYTDTNRRITLIPAVLWRFRSNSPSLRIGLNYISDDTRFFSPLYYTPEEFRALNLIADYVVDRGRWQYGITGSTPLTNRNGTASGRPAKTLFGYANYDASDILSLFASGGIVRAPNFHSDDLLAGLTLRLP
jgi:tetratricopeptide (TPR) repeat protein